MDLERFEELIAAELDGVLSAEDRRELEAACAENPGLRRLREQDLKLVDMLSRRGPEHAPSALVTAVMDRVDQEAPRSESARSAPAPRATEIRLQAQPEPWWSKVFGLAVVRWGFGLAVLALPASMVLLLVYQTGLRDPAKPRSVASTGGEQRSENQAAASARFEVAQVQPSATESAAEPVGVRAAKRVAPDADLQADAISALAEPEADRPLEQRQLADATILGGTQSNRKRAAMADPAPLGRTEAAERAPAESNEPSVPRVVFERSALRQAPRNEPVEQADETAEPDSTDPRPKPRVVVERFRPSSEPAASTTSESAAAASAEPGAFFRSRDSLDAEVAALPETSAPGVEPTAPSEQPADRPETSPAPLEPAAPSVRGVFETAAPQQPTGPEAEESLPSALRVFETAAAQGSAANAGQAPPSAAARAPSPGAGQRPAVAEPFFDAPEVQPTPVATPRRALRALASRGDDQIKNDDKESAPPSAALALSRVRGQPSPSGLLIGIELAAAPPEAPRRRPAEGRVSRDSSDLRRGFATSRGSRARGNGAEVLRQLEMAIARRGGKDLAKRADAADPRLTRLSFRMLPSQVATLMKDIESLGITRSEQPAGARRVTIGRAPEAPSSSIYVIERGRLPGPGAGARPGTVGQARSEQEISVEITVRTRQ